MSTGKQLRWRRFLSSTTGHALMVPIDHGLTVGPIAGVSSVAEIGRWIRHGAITGVIAHKGIIERLAARGLLESAGVMMHLNGMSALAAAPDRKEMLTSMETAVRLGADGVSVQVNFDGANDGHNLALLGSVVDDAARFGLPVLAMVYDKVSAASASEAQGRLRHLMRIAIELGVDAIKIAPPDNVSEIAPLLEGIAEDVAVLFAGGALSNDMDIVALARGARLAGGAGLCVGRNTFQRRAPGEMLDKLHAAMLDRARPVNGARPPREHTPTLAAVGTG